MRRLLLAIALAGLMAAPGRAEIVDLQLVLAADVSRSVDDNEFRLQREGYAAALTDPRVLRAIQSGQVGRIAVCYFEWAGESFQQMIVDWTIIGDEETAGLFADKLHKTPRPFANRTSIGVAIDYAAEQFLRSGHESQRRTIDVSGDGTNTNGKHPAIARDQAVAKGITVNGLVILSPEPMPWNPWHTHPPEGLEEYYRQNVIGGTGAFVIAAEDFNSFAFAIVNKLIREIAQTPPEYEVAEFQ